MKIRSLGKTFPWINSIKIFSHSPNKKSIHRMITNSFKAAEIWIKMSHLSISIIKSGIKTKETETCSKTCWIHPFLKLTSLILKRRICIKTFSNMNNLRSQACSILIMNNNQINSISLNNFKLIKNSWIKKCSSSKFHTIFNTWINFKILAAIVNNILTINSLFKIIIIFKIFSNIIMSRAFWAKWKMQLSIKLIWILIIWSILSKKNSSLSKYKIIKSFWNSSISQIVRSDYNL